MNTDIALARKIGMRYRITPSGTEEPYGTALEIQAFADAVRFREQVQTLLVQFEIREHYHEKALRRKALLKEVFERSKELSIPPDLLERIRSELTYEFNLKESP